MNQFAGKLELEAGITVLQNECERIFSSVPIHFGKGVSLTHGASIYCTGVGDDIYIGDNNIMSHGCTITQDVPDNSLVVGRRGLIFNK